MFVSHTVQRHSDDRGLIADFVLERNQIWNLSQASGAPGSPKIQEDNLATKIGEPDGPSIEVGKGKVRHGRSGGSENLRVRKHARSLWIISGVEFPPFFTSSDTLSDEFCVGGIGPAACSFL